MDQQKIGGFLKELRKEKGVTQEQLAERFSVSNSYKGSNRFCARISPWNAFGRHINV